ncbi:hypothetical protein [Vibrio comitans]|uniref:Outer membrane porin, OprD family n=1 Tax=Vibrio comitans NBRC 102076 TaxID=1219078 RepID=A0A4Y3IQM6_9VIBR|nr:hypothetical protein [Vibrio comitans]GEA61164.1 hypothetical protein VCO01S_23570 [Vibrio comitans NBRC 102076]
MNIHNSQSDDKLLPVRKNKISTAFILASILPFTVIGSDLEEVDALSLSGEIIDGRLDEILSISDEDVGEFVSLERSHTLDLLLKNEYRNADRPSASGDYGPKIDAWVQYFGFDYQTQNLLPWLDIQAGVHSTAKIHADPNKSSRFYLDGHDGFTLFTGTVNLKPTDNIELQLGRYGTDYYAGTLDYFVPLLDESSVRTTPSYKEGALLKVNTGSFHWYGAVASRFGGGYYSDWEDYGVTTIDPTTGELQVDEDYKYFLSSIWDNRQDSGTEIGVGLSFMEEHSYQGMINASQMYIDSNQSFWKAEIRAFYAQLIGRTKDNNSDYMAMMGLDDEDNTFAVSGQLTFNRDAITVIGSIGQVGTKLSPLTLVDTDVGFSFDQSIDRNHEDMLAWQLGGFYQATEHLNVGLAMVITDGYEDSSKQVEVVGTGANFIVQHKGYGQLKGLDTTLILNKAVEYREGSSFGDKLDYYDIKLTFHYPINII